MSEAFDKMREQGIVAVLRSESVEQAYSVAQACVAGGVELVEVTFSVPDAAAAIRALVGGEAFVGAGTVLTSVQANAALDAGARFLVGPTYNPEIATIAKNAGVPYVPGCMTPNEMQTAYEAGCEAVKLFPSSSFDPGFIKAVHAPLPHLNIMPTGGINLENTAAWIAAGAFCVGVGGNLTKMGSDDLAGITAAAKAYREQVALGRALA